MKIRRTAEGPDQVSEARDMLVRFGFSLRPGTARSCGAGITFTVSTTMIRSAEAALFMRTAKSNGPRFTLSRAVPATHVKRKMMPLQTDSTLPQMALNVDGVNRKRKLADVQTAVTFFLNEFIQSEHSVKFSGEVLLQQTTNFRLVLVHKPSSAADRFVLHVPKNIQKGLQLPVLSMSPYLEEREYSSEEHDEKLDRLKE